MSCVHNTQKHSILYTLTYLRIKWLHEKMWNWDKVWFTLYAWRGDKTDLSTIFFFMLNKYTGTMLVKWSAFQWLWCNTTSNYNNKNWCIKVMWQKCSLLWWSGWTCFYELFSLLFTLSLNPICVAMMWKIDTIHIFWGQNAESMSFFWAKNKIKNLPQIEINWIINMSLS